MEEWVIGILFTILFFLLVGTIPLLVLAIVHTCIASSRTRKWKKEKALRLAKATNSANDADVDVEMRRLVEDGEDAQLEADLDPEDSDDEAEIKQREEVERDWTLTTRQKFKKEWKKSWAENATKNALEAREKAERKKLAKEVAKEMLKAERKRNRLASAQASSSSAAAADVSDEDSLPSYNNAVAGDVKR